MGLWNGTIRTKEVDRDRNNCGDEGGGGRETEDPPTGAQDAVTGGEYHMNRGDTENNAANDEEEFIDDTMGTARGGETAGWEGEAGRMQTKRPGTPADSGG